LKFSSVEVRQFLANNWGSVQAVLQKVLESALAGGQLVFQIAANLLLAPVAMFYLLRDWNDLRQRLARFVPRPWHEKVLKLAGEVDKVLAEFLRGQVSVMALLSIYYSIALWLADINFALPLGLITGLLVFIPYLGYATGLTLALLVALLQLQGWAPIVGVLVVYGAGQILESFMLTPFLMGKRIGLHPLAVIFALLAFGQLFGFFGVLLALPVSAILLVGLRHVRGMYVTSQFYRGAE
jgi:predicted PurR-regulated permease PerM